MTRKSCSLMVVALALALALSTPGLAAEPAPTTITIPKMHCSGCAKSIVAKLVEVLGVAKAEPDVPAKTVKVTPKADVVLSPKALWEAVENAKKTPSKLEGPSGTFTSKPPQ